MYVYQSIAQSLADHSLDTMFGLMGDANLFMVDHFVRDTGARFVPVAYEGSAVLMALAHGRVAGRVGLATITHGPALTNCVTALTEAARAREAAHRGQTEDKTVFDIADSGALIDRDERQAFERILQEIEYGKKK